MAVLALRVLMRTLGKLVPVPTVGTGRRELLSGTEEIAANRNDVDLMDSLSTDWRRTGLRND
jgi:hypothetical protein